jgi:endonuclease YncB( thermonuclease family)
LADITGPARIIDGDTIDIAGQGIRLHGIDAPERSQMCIVGLAVWLCSSTARYIICTLYEVSGGR